MLRFVALALVAVFSPLQPIQDSESGFVRLVDGGRLQGAKYHGAETAAPSIADDVLTLHGGTGWIATDTEFVDFDLRADVRLDSPQAALTFLLRVRRDAKTSGEQRYGYGIRLAGVDNEGKRHSSVSIYGAAPQNVPFQKDLLAEQMMRSTGWQPIEVVCRGLKCEVLVEGNDVTTLSNVQPFIGAVGLSAEGGDVMFRNLRIGRLFPISDGFAKGAYLMGDPDVKVPHLIHAERPMYTAAAMAAKIEGPVLLECVVREDGAVGEGVILQSLDPGLDHEAIVAAKKWVFSPAMLHGKPVPTLVTIELKFVLKP